MTIDLDPTLLRLGPLAVTWYGLAVAAGLGAGVWLAVGEARRKGLPLEHLDQLVLWVVVGGVVGARLFHVVDHWEVYAKEPLRMLAVHEGGLAILGAIIGGTLGGSAAALRLGLPIRRLSDAAAPGVVLGQAIGRFGCLVNGDALGRPVADGFGVTYLNPGALAPQLGVAYTPVFLYEQVWDLLVFAILWLTRTRLRVDGQLFAAYLALYAVGKFALSYLRTEREWLLGLQEAQVLALATLAIAILWTRWPRRVGVSVRS